jgi:hypothetical protein
MINKGGALACWLAFALLATNGCTNESNTSQLAASTPPALSETIISVRTLGGATQAGVLSMRGDASEVRYLAVIIPGNPGILRPTDGPDGSVRTRQAGNFLIRSRRHLVDNDIAALLVDCRSDFLQMCEDGYQASEDRVRDIEALVAHTRSQLPAVSEIWMVSTSRGAIASAAAVRYAGTTFSGAIHTAGMLDRARELGLDFRGTVPQFLIHHVEDPCPVTSYASARNLAGEREIPLITARGGSGFSGRPCDAFTQHGFTGIESTVMGRVRAVIRGVDRTAGTVP